MARSPVHDEQRKTAEHESLRWRGGLERRHSGGGREAPIRPIVSGQTIAGNHPCRDCASWSSRRLSHERLTSTIASRHPLGTASKLASPPWRSATALAANAPAAAAWPPGRSVAASSSKN